MVKFTHVIFLEGEKMNIDIELCISSVIMAIAYYVMGKYLFSNNNKIKITDILYILLFGIIITIINNTNPTILDNVLKTIIVFICCIGFYRLIFRETIDKLVLSTFISYLNIFIGEIIVDIIFVIVVHVFNYKNLDYFRNNIGISLIVSIVAIISVILRKEKLSKMVKEINSSTKIIGIISAIILITFSLLLFKTPLKQIKLDSNLIITILLLILLCIIGFILIKQRNESDNLIDKYSKLASYSQNNEGLLEEYRENLHETKNQLILIDSMVPKKYKDVHEYIATLLEKDKKKKYYFLNDLKNIPLNELKGFMNFKIIEMINQKVNVEVNVSKEIKKNFFKNFKTSDKDDLYSIIGVLLDNARDAALECKDKTVSIEIFMMNNDLKIIIANTYKGTIDLEKIDNYGYTTKGQNHGTGLHIVSRIIGKNPIFEKETQILDNFFIQIITIHKK